MTVTLEQTLDFIVDALPYILALLALAQAGAALLGSRAAQKQARAAMDQVDLLKRQLSLAEDIALMELQPNFRMKYVGAAELGMVEHSPGGTTVFSPLDSEGRDAPDRWQRRRSFLLECIAAPGPILVSVEALPGDVTCLIDSELPASNGSVIEGELYIPLDLAEEKVTLTVSSHMASNPGRRWTKQVKLLQDLAGT